MTSKANPGLHSGIVFRGVDLQKTKTCSKNKLELAQIERSSEIDAKRSLPIEKDDEIELIDLSILTNTNPKDEAELSSLNSRITPRHPVKWWIYDAGGSCKEYPDGSIELTGDPSGKLHELYPKCDAEVKCDICSARRPPYRTITGEKVKPTQIIALLTQNLDASAPDEKIEPSRSASDFPWWNQPDEGYYEAGAKKGLAEFIADTRENYYFVEENSKHRLKFRCPEMARSDKECGRLGDYDDDEGSIEAELNKYGESWVDNPLSDIGDILIYVNPENEQAVWHCPRCSISQGKKVVHTLSHSLREELAKEGLIPSKEYKHKDRLAEAPRLLEIISEKQGLSFYELDQMMGWGTDGRTSERIIKKQLKDKVKLRKGRKGNKGYKVYIYH